MAWDAKQKWQGLNKIKIKEKIIGKIVGHIELQSGVALNSQELVGVEFAADDIVRTIQNSYRRRKRQ